ncbi:hypothetical protein ACFQ7J_00080 [Streptomyces sp. NPDC056501]|uniref:hypothetical protein n=1 Tax=Streptomyces sp. NPDC056501 TaxID=3345841 RepID=UPI003693CAE0
MLWRPTGGRWTISGSATRPSGARRTTTACSLSVRDGNLTVQVDLGSEWFPAPTCNASTVDIARAALNAVPH